MSGWDWYQEGGAYDNKYGELERRRRERLEEALDEQERNGPPEDDAPPPGPDDAPLWLQDEPEAPEITRLRREWLGELTRQTAWGAR